MSKFATRLVTPIVPQPKEKILPPGWRWAKIPDLINAGGVFNDGDWVETVDQDPNGGVRLIQLADVGDGVYRDRSSRFLTAKKAAELGCTFLKCGDVLIARMPDPLGRACIFPDPEKPSVTVVDVCIVRTEGGADHRWLMHFLNAPDFRVSVAALQSGSTRKRISRSNLAKLLLPVPPLAEQHRLVSEIEKQFTRLDAGVESLKRVQVTLKRYRASVLKAACEGRLVPTEAELARRQGRTYETGKRLLEQFAKDRRAQWEDSQLAKLRAAGITANSKRRIQKYKEPNPPGVWQRSVIPEGWVCVSLDQISDLITDGDHNPPPRVNDGIPHLTAKNIRNWNFDLKGCTYVSRPDAQQVFKRYKPRAGDLIVTCVGTVGRTAIVPDGLVFSPDRNLAAIRLLGSKSLTRYVQSFLNSHDSQQRLLSASGATAQPHLYLGDLRQFALGLPPRAEQERIIAEVERRFSVLDELERAATANMKRAERLRQSILHSAFTGKL